MGGSTDSWDVSEISISDRRGEIQIDTSGDSNGVYDSIIKKVDGTRRFVEFIKGLTDKAARDDQELRRRKGEPPTAQAAPKPNPTVSSDPPVENGPLAEDLPQLQGAPDLAVPKDDVIILKTEGQSTQPLIDNDNPNEPAYDPLVPIPAEDVANLIFPPPATATDYNALIDSVLRNKPKPGKKDLTFASPAARKKAEDGDPVDLFTGAFTIDVIDLVVPTPHIPIAMSRSYRSGRSYFGPFGFGWDHPYNVYLRALDDGGFALWTGHLQEQHFSAAGGDFEPDPGFAARLERIAGLADVYRVHFAGGLVWQFEQPTGWGDAQRIPLTIIRDRHNNAVNLTYGSFNQLISVLDAAGRGLLFQYGSCKLLERVTDHTGSRVVQYWHDDEIEHMVRVILPATAQYPKGFSTFYEYDSYASHPAMRHNILRIHDADDRVMVENEYAGPEAGWEFNSVVRQRLAGFEYQFEYQQIQYVFPDPQYVEVLASRTLVRTPDSTLHTYTFNYRGDLLDYRFRLSRDGSYRVISSQWVHDAEGNITATTGPDGLRKFFTYDTANADPCARHNLVRVELASPLSGIVASRVLYEGQYEPRYQLLTRMLDEMRAETRFVYDFDANPVAATGRLARIHLPAVVGVDGVSQQSDLLFEHNVHGQLTATVKPEGGRTEFAYISGGLHDGFLAEITQDPATTRLVSKFVYDAAGYLSQTHAPGGRTMGFTHNALGQVEKMVAPEVGGQSAEIHRWFDDSGSVIRLARPAGSSAASVILGTSIVDEYERDVVGNIRSVTLAANTDVPRKWLQCVDHEGRPVSTWDAAGKRIDRCYGENGVLLSETAAAGEVEAQTTKYVYDRAERMTQMTGPWKDVTTIKYDIWGRPQHITLPSGAVRTLDLGKNDLLLEERVAESPTDPVAPSRLLQRQTYEYDQRGRLIASILWSFRDELVPAVPLKTRYLYDKDDNLRKLLLPRGAEVQYEFDKIGRMTKLTDPHGNVRQVAYDASGDLNKLTEIEVEDGVARTRTRINTYDERGRLKRSEELGSFAQFQYDDRDLLIEQRAPTGVTNRLQFDPLGQVIENLIDPGGLALRSQYEYDLNGRLRRYIDPTGQSTTWERDPLGRVVAIKPPDGTSWDTITDTNARTVEQRMPSGNRVVLEYGENTSQPVKIGYVAAPGQEAVAPHKLAYDGMGRLVSALVGADLVLRRYDSLGRLIEETTRGKTVRMEYDDVTGAEDLVFPDGRRERTEHNAAGQPTRIALVTPGGLGGSAGDVLLEILYSTAGRPARMRYGNGVEGRLAHDNLGRVIRIDYQKGGVLLDSCRLRYDEGGHRAVVQYLGAPARNSVHRFDGRQRLVEARSGFPLAALPDVTAPAAQAADVAAARVAAVVAPGASFSLDGADARTKVTGSNGGAASVNYVSAPDHRLIAAGASTISYNPDGTRTGDARYTYELDALNRVRRVRDRATNAIVAELHYDALSRVATGTTDGRVFERWFAGSTQIHEVSGPVPGAARQHSPHPLWPAPLCVVDVTGPAYIHQDEGWSTMCLTGAAGDVLERHRFDIFGASAAFAADGVTPLASLRTEPMWRGMPALGTTTLFRTPKRLYDPELGVFTSPDPLLYADSPSPYAYAAHNPVDFADPTGLGKTPLGEMPQPNTPIHQETSEQIESSWIYPTTKHSMFTMEHGYDTGNKPVNYALNKVLLPWRNWLAGIGNIPFEMMGDFDDAMSRSRFQKEWEAAQVMSPLSKTMGIAVEAGAAMKFARAWLSTNKQLKAAVTAPVFLFMGAGGMGGSTAKAPLTVVEHLGQTPAISEAVLIDPPAGRLKQLVTLAERGEVTWVAGNAQASAAYAEAMAAKTSNTGGREGFNLLRNRLSRRIDVQGPIHHWRFPISEYSTEALAAENFYLTRGTGHLRLHQAMGSGAIYRSMAWGVEMEIQSMFNFWNTRTSVPLNQVLDLLP